MSNQFRYLFTPIKIGGVEVRNRIMNTGHVTRLVKDHVITEQAAIYWAEKAKGGAGLVVPDPVQVHPSMGNMPFLPGGWDDNMIPGYKLMAKMVHEYGGKIFCQAAHAGRQSMSSVSERALWAPSAIPCPVNREMPKEMEIEDIKDIVNSWAEAARRIREADIDGVEIHSGHGGYFLGQWMSPYANKRTDEYGGSLENRMRIVIEIIEAIRKKVGDDYVVGMQINGDDYTPGGLTPDDLIEIAVRLEATGKLDYICVKGGTYFCMHMIIPDMQHPMGMWIPLASGVRGSVESIPIFAAGRIIDPVVAENILADGHADMVAMTRQQLCDPETANKAREGRLEDIRNCMGCNQGCIDMLFKSRHITCTHNPTVAKEKEMGIGSLKAAGKKKKVMVVGGGPAGLKVAEIAARRGHDVTLYEKGKELGGQVRISAKASGRDEFGGSVRWLEIQVKKLGVKINLEAEVTPAIVEKENPDTVVVATGSRPTRSLIGYLSYGIEGIHGLDQDNVLDTWQILEGDKELGDNVLIVDDGEGTWKGVIVAETLVDRGKNVEIISPLAIVGLSIGAFSQMAMVPRLFGKNVKLSPFTLLMGISGNTVSVIRQGKPDTIEDVDTVVLAGWHEADEDLYFALKGKVKELHRIGDCVAPRTVIDAVREGEEVGRLL